ncbi:YitT family protein [Sporosarcina sp. PTS2304]|uniref:YitT family protein n=1 Tax=Sporosarcina sp. PTS2304 TaxID=2283194 RepID=UPI000E0CF606|nr:YitT family protein [Sporosarcina sp. PTS2304]AXI00791.1 YitT family protein [Sporosarcina sp. PTS2304]
MQRRLIDYSALLFGSFIFAIGINYFAIPNMLSEGGVIGITIISYYLFEWSPAIVSFVLNLVLIIIGYKLFSKRTIIYTLVTIVFMSVFLSVTENWGVPLGNDALLAALFAGLFVGAGLGMIFRVGGTSGGATTLARMMQKFLGWSVGKSMLVIDITVILLSVFVIGKEKAMYTLVAVFVGAKVIDKIVDGADDRKAVMIISKHQEAIRQELLTTMGRGVTILDGRGGYTLEKQSILYIIINQTEIVQLRRILERVDEDAYVTINNVQEIFKRGFKEQRLRTK